MTEDAVRVFISYSHKDEALRDSLDTHLSNLRRDGVISSWYDRQIPEYPQPLRNDIKAELESAGIILLLISPDFVASNYCWGNEMAQAMKRHEVGEAIVVPVILRHCDWFGLPFAKFQAFPKDAKPVTSWANQDEAFVSIAQGIETAAKLTLDYRKQKQKEVSVSQARYLKIVEETLSDGIISLIERDTLDELREELGLTPEEATEIEERTYEPYRRYEENLNKYKQTINRLIENGFYPFSDEIKRDLELHQRDLGIKSEDAARIELIMLEQAELVQQQRNLPLSKRIGELEKNISKTTKQPETQRETVSDSNVNPPLSKPVVELEKPAPKTAEQPESLRETKSDSKANKEIFISYAWGGDSEEFVNKLDASLQKQGLVIVRDKRDLEYKGLIKEFMERIGRGNCVIAVISDKYLKSPNCMFELVQISKAGEFSNRIFPIVLPDAQIYKPVERISYIAHWEGEIKALEEAVKAVGLANLQGFYEEINKFSDIRRAISELLAILGNMNTLTASMHSEGDFKDLIEKIQAKLVE